MKTLSRTTYRVVFLMIIITGIGIAFSGCASKVTVTPAPKTLRWVSYNRLGIILVFDGHGTLVGFQQQPPAPAKGKVPFAYTTHLTSSASAVTVKPGMSSQDIKRLFGKPYAEAAGTDRVRFIEYGKVLNDVLLLDRGFRSFEFSNEHLIKASEFYTDFHLSHGVSFGMTLQQVTASYGKPDAKGNGTDIEISSFY